MTPSDAISYTNERREREWCELLYLTTNSVYVQGLVGLIGGIRSLARKCPVQLLDPERLGSTIQADMWSYSMVGGTTVVKWD